MWIFQSRLFLRDLQKIKSLTATNNTLKLKHGMLSLQYISWTSLSSLSMLRLCVGLLRASNHSKSLMIMDFRHWWRLDDLTSISHLQRLYPMTLRMFSYVDCKGATGKVSLTSIVNLFHNVPCRKTMAPSALLLTHGHHLITKCM